MVRTLVLTALLVLAVAPAAGAAQRYAAPNGSSTGQCPATAPCALDRAVNSAADGDEVIVTPGTYTLAKKLQPRGELDMHGDPNFAWPKIVGTGSLKEPILTLDGGTLRHVWIHASANKEALVLKEGVVDGARLESAGGDAATVYGSDATVIRNSVVVSTGPTDSAAVWLRDGSGANSVEIRNVTAMATAGTANGIHCDLTRGSGARILNSIARGTGFDLDFTSACSVAFSNFRPAFSTGPVSGTGNQSAEPLFADGDYRPAAGSPTIDAGALDALSTSPDPDGRPRSLGAAPDIGAYEYVPPAPTDGDAPSGQLPDDLKGMPLPQQGRSVLVDPERGTVRIRPRGAKRFTTLAEPGRIPLGSLIDTRHGAIDLVSAIDEGRVQTGRFWGAQFTTSQRRRGSGMTTLTLRGGNFSAAACRTRPADHATAVASRKHKKPRRGLWARDHGGRFRTHGNDSVATARGTAWFTKDTCAGTTTRVKEGAVLVRDLVRHKRVLVKAGHSYLARKHS
jgi:hypothetical protein